MRASPIVALVLSVLPAFALGCIDDLELPQVVIDSRPLGARMEIAGDPGRAWPMADDTGTLTWLVVDPTETTPHGWGFIVCPALSLPTGLKVCSAEPTDIILQETPTLEPPAITISFSEADFAGVDTVLIQGVLCPDGSPIVDVSVPDVTCSGMTEPRQLVSYTVRIARGDISPNRNPTIPDDALTFEGAPWVEASAVPPETGCAAMAGTESLPLISRGTAEDPAEATITITGDQSDREEYPVGDGTVQEDLVFAHYTTVGEPGRQFTVIDGVETSGELTWVLPVEASEISPDGTLARWWVTLIDQRGGTDWTRRFACVVP